MSEAKISNWSRAAWYNPRSIWRSLVLRPRVYFGALVGLAALVVLPGWLSPATREAVAWCLAGATYLALSFGTMTWCTSEKIRARAARQDDSGIVILALILLAMFSSVFAIFGLIGDAKLASNEVKLLYVGLAACTIITAWTVIQVVFTLHYAHAYYAPSSDDASRKTALAFPNDDVPDYWDFFYFATSIGATSQTSDVSINSKSIRRLVTLHAIISFFFNTMVLALTINLAASLA